MHRKILWHGVRYFTERRRHWSERCWWLIAIAVSFVLCGNAIRAYWMNWSETPVRFTEEQLPISAIPFPTVRCQNLFHFTISFRFIIHCNWLIWYESYHFTKQLIALKINPLLNHHLQLKVTFCPGIKASRTKLNLSKSVFDLSIEDVSLPLSKLSNTLKISY